MRQDEEDFGEVILAGLNGTVFVSANDNGISLGISNCHDIDGPPQISITLTPRQLNIMVDFLKMYISSENDDAT